MPGGRLGLDLVKPHLSFLKGAGFGIAKGIRNLAQVCGVVKVVFNCQWTWLICTNSLF
jgi:hypothetical protein